MDLFDFVVGSKPIALDDKIKEIFYKNCSGYAYFEESDIEENNIKKDKPNSGKSISVAGTKVFEVYEDNALKCKLNVIAKFSLWEFTNKKPTTEINNLSMVKIINVDGLLNKLNEIAYEVFLFCLNFIQAESFGCCHLFTECSDAMKCITQYRDLYLGCYYRRNLESGKIFYGKNKNI